MRLTTPTILRVIAVFLGGLAAIAAVVELSRAVLPESAAEVATDKPLSTVRARCRDLTPEEYATDQACRDAWDESRRRFFGLPSDTAETE